MHGITRVVIFCSLIILLPTMLLVVPLYLRHSLYANVVYTVAESDIMEIDDGISTIFCSEHTLKMNTPFHAFKVSQRPEITSYRKHIRLKKSMTLPDDTIEYWGFYLLQGATVALSVCSRFQGASILVVKGERSLRTCGMMEHNEKKKKIKDNYMPMSNKEFEITVKSSAEKIISREVNGSNETRKIAPNNEPLISNAENLPVIFNDRNMVEVNKEVSPINKEAENSTMKNVNESEISELTKSEERRLNLLREAAVNHIHKHSTGQNGTQKGIEKLRHMRKRLLKMSNQKEDENARENEYPMKYKYSEGKIVEEKRELHSRHEELQSERAKRLRELEAELNSDPEELIEDDGNVETGNRRSRRNENGVKPPWLLDRGVEHGGNALNFTNLDEDSSMSSFENGLLNCYDGQVLLAEQFEPSDLCTNISFLVNTKRIQTQHNVVESGYYYYIFYSDNDFVSNDMHAVFDIYKPTFKYENLNQSCINKTECSFSLNFLSGDRVIVEVPTRNGIDDTGDDITLLTSTCHPRMGVYSIFPIAVLLLVLGCAFL